MYSISQEICTRFLLCCALFLVIHWLIFPYPSGLLHWHCGNLTIAPVPAKQPWWIWINTACEFIMNDCITTTKQSTTKPCAYFLGYTVHIASSVRFVFQTIYEYQFCYSMCGRCSVECHGVFTFHVTPKSNEPTQAVETRPWHVANRILWPYEYF